MDAGTRNPFEPPHTDLDGDAAPAPGPMVVSTEASRELIAAAPWVRALARLAMLAIAIQLLALVGELRHATRTAAAMLIVVRCCNITISTLFLRVLRRYATASARLRDGNADAVGPILTAQASYLKL